MKKVLMVMFALTLFVCLSLTVCAAEDAVTLNIEFDSQPLEIKYVVQNERTLVPATDLCKALGCELDGGKDSMILVSNDKKTLAFDTTDMIAIVSDNSTGETKALSVDMSAKIIDDEIYLPLRVVCEEFGKFVGWSMPKGRVIVKNPEDVTELKVLAIGNSFSTDAMYWLYNIADDYGIDNIVLGNLYISGASLEKHATKLKANEPAYKYYKNTFGTWITNENAYLIDGIADEDWDVIAFQQVSGSSGKPETFEPYLTEVMDYVTANKTNPDAKYVWHATWAYENDTKNKSFVNYNNSQDEMYAAINDAVQNTILTDERFDYIIPCTTAVQNARKNLNTRITRSDGYHMSLQLGRYIVALTWFHAITGNEIADIDYVPDREIIPENYQAVIKECVKNAVADPFTVK